MCSLAGGFEGQLKTVVRCKVRGRFMQCSQQGLFGLDHGLDSKRALCSRIIPRGVLIFFNRNVHERPQIKDLD